MSNFVQKSLDNFRNKRFIEKQFQITHHKKLNWSFPSTYSEKVCVFKNSDEAETLWPYMDKFEVRDYVKGTIGPQFLNKLYGVYNNTSEIDPKKFPDRFVLKTTHGSGWNVFCRDKKAFNWQESKSKLDTWMKMNFYNETRERQCKLITPRIICERYLEDKKGGLPDFKFFCFDGQPRFIEIDIDRFNNHRRNFYDMSWNILPISLLYQRSRKPFSKPRNFNKMVAIVKQLAAGFKHVRVDLYNVDGKILFSELTFTPGAGLRTFKPEKYEKIIGGYFNL